ncbi:MAG: FKBP-type peptidyl-prolyl cis-trans isomerase [Cycloclasticus sp.]
MQITKDTVARLHYTLKNDEDNIIESSNANEPIAYLQGHGGMIRGVQLALEGKQAGDKFSVSVEPHDGYGERRDNAIQSVPVKHLMGAKKWRPGMIATVQTDKGQHQVSIVKVGKFMAKVDTNHPLAGQTLHFDIEVVDVREATQEEIAHGHAHGAGGHQH